MIEKWLPASLKNVDNSFYETFLIEAENIIKEFTDDRIKTIKNIYSISRGSKDDIIGVASNIYLIDKNILNSTLTFLVEQCSNIISSHPQKVKDLISVYFQLNLIEYDVDEKPKGLYLQSPLESDFSDNKSIDKFIEVISYSVPTVTIRIDNGIFYFDYPPLATEDVRENLRISLINSICDYAVTYKTGFESFLGKDPVAEGYIRSLIHSEPVFTIEFIQFDKNIADELGQVIKFSINYSNYTIDSNYLYISYSNAETIATEILKDEISKIPVSIAHRGTKKFYESLFSTLNYSYPGIISLLKTKDDSRVGRLITNIDLSKHPIDDSETNFVAVPIVEKFTATEEFVNTLDDDTIDPELAKLDSDNIFNRLDQISQSEETLYKKDIFIGFVLNKNNFYGKSVYPYELSRYLLEMVNLNQKATDVIHLTPIISIDIDKNDKNKTISLPSDNKFISIYNTNVNYADLISEDLQIKMTAFEYNEVSGDYFKFYDYYLQDVIDYKYDKNKKVLTYNALIEGKRYRASRINYNTEESTSKKIICNISDISNYITKKLIIKLFVKNEEYNTFYLFKQVENRYFEQCFGPTDSDGKLLYDIDVKIENNQIIFESTQEFASTEDEYQITLSSDKLETKVSKVEFNVLSNGSEYLLNSFTFEKDETNLYIDLPSTVNLMFLISRHEGE